MSEYCHFYACVHVPYGGWLTESFSFFSLFIRAMPGGYRRRTDTNFWNPETMILFLQEENRRIVWLPCVCVALWMNVPALANWNIPFETCHALLFLGRQSAFGLEGPTAAVSPSIFVSFLARISSEVVIFSMSRIRSASLLVKAHDTISLLCDEVPRA